MKIGILSLQGAIEEHEQAIKNAGNKLNIPIQTARVILPKEIQDVDGLIMPGGESSAMILIGSKNGMLNVVKEKIASGLPVFGTCAGAILLSKYVMRNENSEVKEGAFPFLDIEILRNGYGRQVDSFSTLLQIDSESMPFEGIFIRAPQIKKINGNVISHAKFKDDHVFIQQDNIIATTFHPELTQDSRIHEIFVNLIVNRT